MAILVEITGWRFQLDDEPNLYISKWVEITISIHFKLVGFGVTYGVFLFKPGVGFSSRLDKKDENFIGSMSNEIQKII